MAKLFDNQDMRVFAGPAALLALFVAVADLKNVIEVFDFLQYYIIYVSPYQIIIPLVTLVVAEIKVRRQKALADSQHEEKNA